MNPANVFFMQQAGFKDRLQAIADTTNCHIKQIGYFMLGKPKVTISGLNLHNESMMFSFFDFYSSSIHDNYVLIIQTPLFEMFGFEVS